MKITDLKVMRGSPFKTINDLAKELNVTKVTIRTRKKELENEKERYGEYAVIKDGGIVLINYLAFIDYMKYRDRLREKNLRKTVPEFNPKKVAYSLGWYGEEAI